MNITYDPYLLSVPCHEIVCVPVLNNKYGSLNFNFKRKAIEILYFSQELNFSQCSKCFCLEIYWIQHLKYTSTQAKLQTFAES